VELSECVSERYRSAHEYDDGLGHRERNPHDDRLIVRPLQRSGRLQPLLLRLHVRDAPDIEWKLRRLQLHGMLGKHRG
jgi:hypothetical protein